MTRALVHLVGLAAIASTAIAAPESVSNERLLQEVGDLKTQEAQLLDNQTKIEAKLADISKSVRVARIFMSRSGGKHKPAPLPKK
jgi:hypothetical protein